MEDKIEGAGSVIKGTVKDEAGKLGGDKSLELSGTWDKAKGAVQEKIGDAKIEAHKIDAHKP